MNEEQLKSIFPPYTVDIQGSGLHEVYTPEQVIQILTLLGVKELDLLINRFCDCDIEHRPESIY